MDSLATRTGLIGSGSIVGVGGLLYLFLRSQTEDLHEDVGVVLRVSRLRRKMKKLAASKSWTIPDLFEKVARKNKDKEAIFFVDTNTSYTYGQVDEISNQIANWAIKEGLKKGEVVALLMDSRPEYVFVWLGLAKAGIITSLINHNLTGRPLLHSLSVCGAKHFIFGIDHAHKHEELGSQRPEGTYYTMGGAVEGMAHIDPQFTIQSKEAPPRAAREGRTADDHLLYIYTSGTTGNPKASIISSLRFLGASGGFVETYSLKPSDRIYCALPLYHSAGGMVGIGMSWYCQGTFILRGKFSASKFWSDIQASKATIFQYIGELCRYLLAQPPSPADKSNVRLAIGNGLRPDVWPQFQKRFNIKRIGEFYGATEGNVALLNYPGKIGSIGYISPLFSRFVPLKIVKFDVEKEEILRGADGNCIECQHGEPGELISEIIDNEPSQKFVGYTDKSATEKKILADAFRKGDRYFRTGDLVYKDKLGYYYFVDRIGDTFRWKGENVSTGEVALVLSDVPGVQEANVYGVLIPGSDGRAGMATLVVDESVFNMETLYQKIESELPSYARPIFLRFQKQIEITGTFKHMKYNLQKEGFDPNATSDIIYFRDDSKKTFVRMTNELFESINSGAYKSRL